MKTNKLVTLGTKLAKKLEQAQKQSLEKKKTLLLKAQELQEKVENFEKLKQITE